MKKERILALCLEEIQSGKRTFPDCIERYPEIAKELHSLLEIAVSLKPDKVTPSAAFKQRTHLRLLEAMKPAEKKAHFGWRWPELALVRLVAMILAVVWVICVAGGGTVYASQSSLPGDALYPLKTGVENIQLSLTFGSNAKANLHLNLAQRRIDELTQEIKLNREVNPQLLETIRYQFDSAFKELSQSSNLEETKQTLSRLSVASLNQQLELENVISTASPNNQSAVRQIIEETQSSNTIAQVAYSNHDLLEHLPSVADNKLDSGRFSIEGILVSIEDKTWDVGGTILENIHLPGKAPAIGNRIKLEGLVKDKNVFLTKVESSNVFSEPTKIVGQFGGTNQNGTANISGIDVKIKNDSSNMLQLGDKVQLQGGADDNKLKVTSKQSHQNTSPSLNGMLTSVDATQGIITVKATGNLIKINISQAQLVNDHHQTLKIADLNQYLGKDLRLSSLYKRGSLIFCRVIDIEDRD